MSGVSIRCVVGVLLLAAVVAVPMTLAAVPETAQAGELLRRAGAKDTVGLVLDRRGNLYSASRRTGDVFCLPPSSSPVLLARVTGTPTCLAVDRVRTVYVGTESGVIFAVTPDGSVTEACRIGSAARGVAVDRDGGLRVATDDGVVVTVRRD